MAESTTRARPRSTLCRCLDCTRQLTELATSPRNPHIWAPLPPPFYPASHQPAAPAPPAPAPARSCLCPRVEVAEVDGLTSCCLRVHARDHHLTHQQPRVSTDPSPRGRHQCGALYHTVYISVRTPPSKTASNDFTRAKMVWSCCLS